jgi:hypothetical protein
MVCERYKLRDGTVAIVCSRGVRPRKCQVAGCDSYAEYECDGPRPRKKSGTCDKRLCEEHRTKVGDVEVSDVEDTIDYCPECVEKFGALPLGGA